MTYLPIYLPHFIFDTGRILTNQNDESNGPYFTSKKNHPNHNGHVEIDLSKMTKWSSLSLFKLGSFLITFVNKKTIFSSSVL
jgi:hypothetical protein